jgi:hypothetical protein
MAKIVKRFTCFTLQIPNAKYPLTHPLSPSGSLLMHVSDKVYNVEVQFGRRSATNGRSFRTAST